MKDHRIQTLLILILLLITFSATRPSVKAVLWSAETQFTTASSLDYAPAMTQTTDKRIWMFWHSKPLTTTSDIFYNYTDNGVTWSKGFRFTTDPGNDGNPAAVATREGKMWVFWVSDRDGNYEIYYKNSADNGASWSGDCRFTFDGSWDRRPSAMQAQDGRIWVVWWSNRTGNFDLWYRIYNGFEWGQDNQLTNDPNDDIEPWIMQDSDGKIWVFWSTNRIDTGSYQLYYKTSNDNGASWPTETKLTDYKQGWWDGFPSAIQAQDGKIWVVWMADRNGQDFNIYYKTYDGSQWSDDASIVTDPAEDKEPTIFQSADTTIWIAWASGRLGDYDIFYKTTVNTHDVAIASVKASKTAAYQGQVVSIEVEAKNHGTTTETFEVKCYINSILIGSKTVTVALGQIYPITFPWNTSDIALGTYTIRATASIVFGETNIVDNTYIDGIVQVKIPGDINGDGKVNIYDAVYMVRDIDATPNSPNWNNGRSDINDDGIVDVYDIAVLTINFGKHAG